MSKISFCCGYTCSHCKETNLNYDEIIMLNGDNVVQDEEHGGSGDIDQILCYECYDKLYE